MRYERKNRKHNTIKTLTEAQKIVFAPLTFQTISTLINTGILEMLSNESQTISEIIAKTNLSKYAVKLLMEVGEVTEIIEKTDEGKFLTTQLGKVFIYDEMTRVNFNFVKDICYLGASELENSIQNSKAEGLNKFIENSKTIYPLLPNLPTQMKNSWYEFDNFYSDNCFAEVYEIIKKNNPDIIFDIGGNTGKFERICLKNNTQITMLDLQENINERIKDNSLNGCKFEALDVLETKKFPQMSDTILMSQFLDCFSEEEIITILKKIREASQIGTKIYILEPFIDNQIFEGAKYALVHISLYFTCMANGNSKMYSLKDMQTFIQKAGLNINKIYNNIGKYNYTLLECENNARMV